MFQSLFARMLITIAVVAFTSKPQQVFAKHAQSLEGKESLQATPPVSADPATFSLPTTHPLEIATSATKFSRGFKGELERIVASHRGVMGLSVKNLDTGEAISINGSELFPTASTIKLAVMCTTFADFASSPSRFKSYYDTKVYDGTTSTGGAGFVKQFKVGTPVELKELLHFMITVSDNTATNMLTEWLGGPQTVDDWLAAHGFRVTRMLATIGGRMTWNKALRDEWGIGVTTPDEMCRLMEMIRTGTAGTPACTDEMMRLLGHQYFDDGIAGHTPPWVWVGSKSGAVNESRSDNAIVSSPGGTYVVSIYTKDNADKRWTHENEGEVSIGKAATAIYKHFNPGSKWEKPVGTEKF